LCGAGNGVVVRGVKGALLDDVERVNPEEGDVKAAGGGDSVQDSVRYRAALVIKRHTKGGGVISVEVK